MLRLSRSLFGVREKQTKEEKEENKNRIWKNVSLTKAKLKQVGKSKSLNLPGSRFHTTGFSNLLISFE